VSEQILNELDNIEKSIPTTQREITKRKPLTSKGIIVSFSLKKIFIPALGIAAVLIAVLFQWYPWSKKEAVPFASDKPSLAILYFKNNTADAGLDHWRSALCQWLITDLSQSKYINVLAEDRLFSILRRLNLLDARSYAPEDLKKVALKAGVNYVFQASLAKVGDAFRIDYSLQKIDTLESIGSSYVKGEGEDSFSAIVDELTRKIKEDFKLSAKEILSDIDEEVGKITTSSPEAYKYYLEGWKYNNKGESRLSIQSLKKAIAIDPEFAMAYRVLAAGYWNQGHPEKWKESIQKALELSDRISDRERYLIQGHFYTWSGSGKISDQFSYRARLGALYLLQGRFIESKEIMKQGFELAEWGWFHLYLVYLHLKSGSPEQALEEYNKAFTTEDELEVSEEERLDLYIKGLVYLEMKSISEAQKIADELEEIIKKGMNKKLTRMHHLLIGMIELKRGNYPRAIEFSKKAVSLLPSQYLIYGDAHALYFEPLALAYYMAGDLEKSQKEYEKIASLTSGRLFWGDIYAKSFYMLGKIFEQQGNTAKAIEHYKKFLSLWKDADPGMAEVEDAKKRMAGLKSN